MTVRAAYPALYEEGVVEVAGVRVSFKAYAGPEAVWSSTPALLVQFTVEYHGESTKGEVVVVTNDVASFIRRNILAAVERGGI